GADVPICLDPRPRIMRGIGDVRSAPIVLPELPAILVNPGVSLPTGNVFALLDRSRAACDPATIAFEGGSPELQDEAALLAYMARNANDLEAPAIALRPVIGDVLSALRALPGCRLARMSGSGATCFALFEREHAAANAKRLKSEHPGWWVRATMLGAG
ncbi:MAG: 4-(cytidine 5'-diphospho)-2-C-methyl-D-erythritol kinase, partial [Pseudorhodoplanes sp.]|nr:4-(cytidine 5'-diphospho)-2-C-methyl-D-erythritol kinase [Pseudorhodoplanes sp.]